MAENDALSKFDFSSFSGSGLWVKFEAGKPLTLRVLTTDPTVESQEFEDKLTGEINISTKFNFIVYNFTDEKAQILSATPTIARKIGELHVDPEFGANIRKLDIRISPTGSGKERRYDLQVLPKAREMTADQVEAVRAINLDEKTKGDRMSLYDPAKVEAKSEEPLPEAPADIEGEPINLDDIPF